MLKKKDKRRMYKIIIYGLLVHFGVTVVIFNSFGLTSRTLGGAVVSLFPFITGLLLLLFSNDLPRIYSDYVYNLRYGRDIFGEEGKKFIDSIRSNTHPLYNIFNYRLMGVLTMLFSCGILVYGIFS